MTDPAYANVDAFSYAHTYLKLIQRDQIDEVIYFGNSPLNISNQSYPYSYKEPVHDKSNFRLISRLFDSLNYFVKKTDCDWMFRVCGDAVINTEAFEPILTELRSEGDPRNNLIMKGACLSKSGHTYLQGGSGIFLSRKAAMQILKDEGLVRSFIRKGSNDDRIFGNYLDAINFSFISASTRLMLGHTPQGYESIENATISSKGLRPCPTNVRSTTKCRLYLQRLKDIAVWHNSRRGDDFPFVGDKIRSTLPENLFFYVPFNEPIFCVANTGAESHYI